MKLRILLADDHEIVRRGLCALLQKHEGWEVCGEASDGREAIEMAKEFSTEQSAAFVNGVLDAMLKENEKLTTDPAPIEPPLPK